MRLRESIRKNLDQYDRIAIWGAGGLGRLAATRWLPADKIAYFVDSNENKVDTIIDGKPVRRPDHLLTDPPDCVVVCSMAFNEIVRSLADLGYSNRVIYVYQTMIEGRKNLSEIDKLKIDIAATKNDPWIKFVLMKPQILVNITFRLTRWSRQRVLTKPLYYPLFLLHALTCAWLSIQLPVNTDIGPGLVFAHFGSIVFTARARIGAFFTIYHCCTIGTSDFGEGPQVGDFVSQFAGSHVLGSCNIGDFSRIGANAVVIDLACEERSTVVGMPARVVGVPST